jgi:hypothetical protein
VKLTVVCGERGGAEGRGERSAFQSTHVICWNVPADGLWATESRASRALIKLTDDAVWSSKLGPFRQYLSFYFKVSLHNINWYRCSFLAEVATRDIYFRVQSVM